MKSLIVTAVSIIAVVLTAAEGQNFHAEPGELDVPTEKVKLIPDGTDFTNSIQQEEKIQHKGKDNKTSCKAKTTCLLLGGSCVTNPTLCNGRLIEGCKGKNCQCCLPGCPETKGFFRPTGSQQCFKFFPGNYNWTQGEDMCNNLGLRLAHPYDAVGLRSYMTQRFGDKNCGSYNCVTWIGARGDGTQYAWESNGRKISLDNPLWYPGKPTVYVSSKYCLLLLARASNWGPYPNRPYGADWCGVRNPVLCEMVLS